MSNLTTPNAPIAIRAILTPDEYGALTQILESSGVLTELILKNMPNSPNLLQSLTSKLLNPQKPTPLECAIEEVLEVRKNPSYSNLYTEEQTLKSNVLCADVIPYLKSLKSYEYIANESEIDEILEEGKSYNTYNSNCNISNDLQFHILYKNDYAYVLFCVHLCGDVRANYTDYFVCRFNNENEMFELDEALQTKEIGEYLFDLNMFAEDYEVFKGGDYVGSFGELYFEGLEF